MKDTPQWAIPMEPVTEDQIVKTYTADVVILGAGHAGTAAARAAAEAGAKVLVGGEKGGAEVGGGIIC